MTISPGDNVGPYHVIEPLGQGGMATVFKAYHRTLDRYVAIKVLHPAFKEDPNFLQRFNREARIVAKLDHPNIVPIYDFAEHEGTPYLVMRYVEGKTLKAVLREGMLEIPRALAIMHPIAAALSYAHAQGVLHRDIKPSNIIRANDGHIYLTDFGLARIAQAGDSTISQDMLIGTPQYISPEQARGESASDCSDVYSLGVVLFEMFAGRVPFNADTPFAIIHDHIYTPLPLPTSIKPDLPVEIEKVLLKALAKEPSARYASATDLMTALEQASGVSISTVATISPPPTPVAPTAPPTTIPEPIKTPMLLVAKPMPAPTALPAKRKSGMKTWAIVGAIILTALVCGGTALALTQRTAIQRWFSALTLSGQSTDPLTAARNKMQSNVQDASAHTQLADELGKRNDFEGAFAEYDRAIRLNPRSPTSYLHASDLAEKQGDFNRALKYAEAGSSAIPQNVDLMIQQADMLLKLKRLDDARTVLEKAERLDATSASLIWRIADLDRMQGKLADALREYTRALAIDPNLPEAHLGMGMLAAGRGATDEAKRQFQMVANNPNAPQELKDQANKQLSLLPEK
jgi:serine/threonine protein kinase